MVLVSLLNDVALHLHVLHDEVGAVERVGHDAAHEGCGQHYGIGLLLVEELLHSELVGEVELLMCAAHEVVVAALFQVVPNGRSHESVVSGNINLTVLI